MNSIYPAVVILLILKLAGSFFILLSFVSYTHFSTLWSSIYEEWVEMDSHGIKNRIFSECPVLRFRFIPSRAESESVFVTYSDLDMGDSFWNLTPVTWLSQIIRFSPDWLEELVLTRITVTRWTDDQILTQWTKWSNLVPVTWSSSCALNPSIL